MGHPLTLRFPNATRYPQHLLAGGVGAFGDLPFNGDVAGQMWVKGNVSPGGDIFVQGDLAGLIRVDGSNSGTTWIKQNITSTGDIHVYGTMAGDIDVDQAMNGSITIDGRLGRGRVLIDGLCDGNISIGEDTGSVSLIHTLGGLGSNGSITINQDALDKKNADGVILVGPPKIPLVLDPITYDGRIHVQRGPTTVGALNGTITIVGCHATYDDLNLCIDGAVNGKVTIAQSGCQNQVGWCCNPPCP